MTLDEAITFWIMQWGEPCFNGKSGWTSEQYRFLVWLGEELRFGNETYWPVLSYTWLRFRQRFQEMKDERNRQSETQVSGGALAPAVRLSRARPRTPTPDSRQVLGGPAQPRHNKARKKLRVRNPGADPEPV